MSPSLAATFQNAAKAASTPCTCSGRGRGGGLEGGEAVGGQMVLWLGVSGLGLDLRIAAWG